MVADFFDTLIERNAKSGQKIRIKKYDAGSESSFKNSLSQLIKIIQI